MNTQKLRDEWRSLNLKLQQIDRVIKMNKIIDVDYLNWVNELKNRRDYLTTII
jgi:hypothetical protein